MKILAILGSPRKKNTYKVLQMFEERFKERGVEFEYLFLKDYELGFCKGCYACMRKGEEKCYNNKIVKQIKERIEAADGIVFASPVFCMQITAMMKNFFDHFAYIIHRPCFLEKSAILLATTQGTGLPASLKYMKTIVKNWGMNVVGELGIRMAYLEREGKSADKIYKKMDKLTESLVSTIQKKERKSPTVSDLIYFRAMRLVIEYTKTQSPADHEYWTERRWFEKNYFVDVRINPLKNTLAKIVARLIKKELD